jgi:hypothetical protein
VFENRVLRRIFRPKRDEETEELYNLKSSQHIFRVIKLRRMRCVGHVARIGESRDAYRFLMGTLEGRRPIERPRRRWEDNIKMDL